MKWTYHKVFKFKSKGENVVSFFNFIPEVHYCNHRVNVKLILLCRNIRIVSYIPSFKHEKKILLSFQFNFNPMVFWFFCHTKIHITRDSLPWQVVRLIDIHPYGNRGVLHLLGTHSVQLIVIGNIPMSKKLKQNYIICLLFLNFFQNIFYLFCNHFVFTFLNFISWRWRTLKSMVLKCNLSSTNENCSIFIPHRNI